jgi:hypothetical protein
MGIKPFQDFRILIDSLDMITHLYPYDRAPVAIIMVYGALRLSQYQLSYRLKAKATYYNLELANCSDGLEPRILQIN